MIGLYSFWFVFAINDLVLVVNGDNTTCLRTSCKETVWNEAQEICESLNGELLRPGHLFAAENPYRDVALKAIREYHQVWVNDTSQAKANTSKCSAYCSKNKINVTLVYVHCNKKFRFLCVMEYCNSSSCVGPPETTSPPKVTNPSLTNNTNSSAVEPRSSRPGTSSLHLAIILACIVAGAIIILVVCVLFVRRCRQPRKYPVRNNSTSENETSFSLPPISHESVFYKPVMVNEDNPATVTETRTEAPAKTPPPRCRNLSSKSEYAIPHMAGNGVCLFDFEEIPNEEPLQKDVSEEEKLANKVENEHITDYDHLWIKKKNTEEDDPTVAYSHLLNHASEEKDAYDKIGLSPFSSRTVDNVYDHPMVTP